MRDDILQRLRQAHDDYRVPNNHAVRDRARRVVYETDQSLGYRGCDSRQVQHVEPSADDLVLFGADSRKWVVNPEFVTCSPCTRPAAPERCGDCSIQAYWIEEV